MENTTVSFGVFNANEMSRELKKHIPKNYTAVCLSRTRKYILVSDGDYYIILKKTPLSFIDDVEDYKYLFSVPISEETKESNLNSVVWNERFGIIQIVFSNDADECSVFEFTYDEDLYNRAKRRFETPPDYTDFIERKRTIRSYMGEIAEVYIERPIGYSCEVNNNTVVYPVNFGYASDIVNDNQKKIGIYVLGIDEPVTNVKAKIIAVVHREDGTEDKLVAAPEGCSFVKENIKKQIDFQEKYFKSFIETPNALFVCTIKDYAFSCKIPKEIEALLSEKINYAYRKNLFRLFSKKEYEDFFEEVKGTTAYEDHKEGKELLPYLVYNPASLYSSIVHNYKIRKMTVPENAKFYLKFIVLDDHLVMYVKLVGFGF